MVEGLLIVNSILAVVIVFTTTMIRNHFGKIERSIEIYRDDRVYKNEDEIQLLQSIIERYQELDLTHKDQFDIDTLIKNNFYKYKVGRFRYNTIENIGTTGSVLLWSILVIQVGYELLTTPVISDKMHLGAIGINVILCFVVTASRVFKNPEPDKNHLFIKIKDYVINAYTMQDLAQQHQKEIKKLTDQIYKLQEKLEIYEKEQSTVVVPAPIPMMAMEQEEIKELFKSLGN